MRHVNRNIICSDKKNLAYAAGTEYDKYENKKVGGWTFLSAPKSHALCLCPLELYTTNPLEPWFSNSANFSGANRFL